MSMNDPSSAHIRAATNTSSGYLPPAQHMPPSPNGRGQMETPSTKDIDGSGGLLTPPPSPPRAKPFTWHPETEDDWNCDGMIPKHQIVVPLRPQTRLRHDAPEFVPSTPMDGSRSQNPQSPPGNRNNLPRTQSWLILVRDRRDRLKRKEARREARKAREEELNTCKSVAEECAGSVLGKEPNEKSGEPIPSYLILDYLRTRYSPRYSPPGLVAASTASQHNFQRGASFFWHNLPPDDERSRMLSSARWLKSDFFAPWYSGVRKPLPPSLFGKTTGEEENDEDESDDDHSEDDYDEIKPHKLPQVKNPCSPFLSEKAPSEEHNKEEEGKDEGVTGNALCSVGEPQASRRSSIITNAYDEDEQPGHNRPSLATAMSYFDQYEPPNGESSAMAEKSLTPNDTQHRLSGGRGLADYNESNERLTSVPQRQSDSRRSRRGPSHSSPRESAMRASAGAPPSPTSELGSRQSVTSIRNSLASSIVPSQPNPHPALPLRPSQQHPENRNSSQQTTLPADPSKRAPATGPYLPNIFDDTYDASPPGSPQPNRRSAQSSLQRSGARDSWGLPLHYGRPEARGASHPAPALRLHPFQHTTAPPRTSTRLQNPQQSPGARDFSRRPTPPAAVPIGPKADKAKRMDRHWRRGGNQNRQQ